MGCHGRRALRGRKGCRARKDSYPLARAGTHVQQPQPASELALSPRSPPRSSKDFPPVGQISSASFALQCSYLAGSHAYDFFDEFIAIVIAQLFGS
jgi:hypothetical protein